MSGSSLSSLSSVCHRLHCLMHTRMNCQAMGTRQKKQSCGWRKNGLPITQVGKMLHTFQRPGRVAVKSLIEHL